LQCPAMAIGKTVVKRTDAGIALRFGGGVASPHAGNYGCS
jgi:hypothetical protein